MPRKKSKPVTLQREAVRYEIRELRGSRVILDADLAKIYGVPLRRLRQQFHSNLHRFPSDFAFELDAQEMLNLGLRAAPTDKLGVRRSVPIAFTDLGAIMVSTILRCEEAVAMSIFVIRAFAEIRHILLETPLQTSKLEELEENLSTRRDGQIETFEKIFEDMKPLLNPVRQQTRRIGFVVPGKGNR